MIVSQSLSRSKRVMAMRPIHALIGLTTVALVGGFSCLGLKAFAQVTTPSILQLPALVKESSLTVSELKGKAEVKQAVVNNWSQLQKQGTFPPGYQVRTLGKSVLVLRWDPTGSLIKLAPRTTIEFRKDRILLWEGRVWLHGKSAKGQKTVVVVESPLALAAISTGQLCVSHLPMVLTSISVDAGMARCVSIKKNKLNVPKGKMVFVYPKGAVTKPRTIGCLGLSVEKKLSCEKSLDQYRANDSQSANLENARVNIESLKALPEKYWLCLEQLLWDIGGFDKIARAPITKRL